MWYFGLIPLVLMIVGTYCVYHFYWREVADIAGDVSPISEFNDEDVAKSQGYEKANE